MTPPSDELLPCVEVEPSAQGARASVIWLHGLGADGHDFEPIVPELGVGDLPIRFVFPHAPHIPVAINMGMVMPAWYDIREIDLQREHDEAGVRRSAEHVIALVARESERGVPAERIVLAGFSQGGAIALHVGLRHEQRFAGVLALSTYLVCPASFDAEFRPHNEGLPVFMAHGTQDPMVPIARGREARDRIAAKGCQVTWFDYPMQHQVCLEEVREIGSWLRNRLGGE